MANVSFWKRVMGLWSGLLSGFLSDVEKEHPAVAYENAIDSMIGKYTRLRSATAGIVRRREDLSARLVARTTELAQLGADLSAALDTKQDDLALVLIERRRAAEQDLAGLGAELDQAKIDAEEAKASLLAVKGEIEKLKAEKDRMLARMQSAQARLQIEEQLNGLSVDSEVRALETVRVHIQNTVAEAKLGAELRNADLEQRLTKLRSLSASSGARAELEALKAQRREPQAVRVEVLDATPPRLTSGRN